MDIFSELQKDDNGAALFYLLMTAGVCFSIYYLLSRSEYLKQKIVYRFGSDPEVAKFLFSKFSGVIFLGIIPFLLIPNISSKFSLDAIGLFPAANPQNSIMWFLVLSGSFIVLNIVLGRTGEAQSKHPQIRKPELKWKDMIILLLGWTVYILCYEFFFRGILFFPLIPKFGIWPAIGVNVFLYGLAHINQGAAETLGALVFGIFFCLATIETGSIWVAATAHLVFSLSGNFTSLYFNPDMRFSGLKNPGK